MDLFNHGFPWEAHEVWEPRWFAAPRDQPERALLQGLIHAAAARVKLHSGAPAPARAFVASACGYLAQARAHDILDLPALISALTTWDARPEAAAPLLVLRVT